MQIPSLMITLVASIIIIIVLILIPINTIIIMTTSILTTTATQIFMTMSRVQMQRIIIELIFNVNDLTLICSHFIK